MSVKIVLLLGAGHCGSTLLNLILDGHDDIFRASEINSLHPFYKDWYINCSDDMKLFWDKVESCVEEKTQINIREFRFDAKSMRKGLKADDRWLEIHRQLYECIAKNSKKKIVVDASKKPKRIYWMLQKKWPIEIIYLSRDGRGLINSYIKKHPSGGFLPAFKIFALINLWRIFMRIRFPRVKRLHVRYEDFANSPEKQLKRICKFVGVEYQPKMLKFSDNKDYYGILGNHSRFQETDEIFVDESWKKELSWKYKTIYMLFGRWLDLINRN